VFANQCPYALNAHPGAFYPRRSIENVRRCYNRDGYAHIYLYANKQYNPLAKFVFIPPYSPTLNAIEPLWKDFKREISVNYPTRSRLTPFAP